MIGADCADVLIVWATFSGCAYRPTTTLRCFECVDDDATFFVMFDFFHMARSC